MDSSVATKNYANSSSTSLGNHFAVLLDEKVTYDNNKAKFSISYVTPNLNTGEAFERTLPKVSTANVLNKDHLGTSRITTSNYIEIEVPKHLFYVEKITVECDRSYNSEGGMTSCKPTFTIHRHEYLKGQQFIVTNIGGKLEAPQIIGVGGGI